MPSEIIDKLIVDFLSLALRSTYDNNCDVVKFNIGFYDTFYFYFYFYYST